MDEEIYRARDEEFLSVLRQCRTGIREDEVDEWKLLRTTAIVNAVGVVTVIGAIESSARAKEMQRDLQSRIDATVRWGVSRDASGAFLAVRNAPEVSREDLARTLMTTLDAGDDRAALLAVAAPGREDVHMRINLLNEALGYSSTEGVRDVLTEMIHDDEVYLYDQMLAAGKLTCGTFLSLDHEVQYRLQAAISTKGLDHSALEGRTWRIHVQYVGEAMYDVCAANPTLPVDQGYAIGVVLTNTDSTLERVLQCGAGLVASDLCTTALMGLGSAGEVVCSYLTSGQDATAMEVARNTAVATAKASRNETIRTWAGLAGSLVSAAEFMECMGE